MGTGSTVGMGLGAVGGGIAGGPMGAMVGAGLGGAIGGMFDDNDPQQAAPVYVDPNDDKFGLNGAGVGTMRDMGASTAGRVAPTTNYSQADADYARSLDARARQESLANRLTGVLDGTGPMSEAQFQLARGQRDAAALGQQMAASARGSSAIMQQRQAQAGAVMGASRANEDAALLKAKEIAQARAELAGVAGTIRAQDQGSRAESAGQQQFLTQTELQNRATNDKASLGYYGLASSEGQAQLDANVRIAQGNQAAGNGVSQFNAGQRSDADQRQRQAQAGLYSGLAAAGTSGMGASKPGTPAPTSSGSPAPAMTGLTPADYTSFEPRQGGGYAPGAGLAGPGGNPYEDSPSPAQPPGAGLYSDPQAPMGNKKPWENY